MDQGLALHGSHRSRSVILIARHVIQEGPWIVGMEGIKGAFIPSVNSALTISLNIRYQ